MANTEDDSERGDEKWYRSPKVLGFTALALASILSLATF
jgi:hypothetical protein